MADINSSLPVRTENAGDVVVKLGDGTLPSQQLAIDASGRVVVKIQDSTGDSLDSTTGSLHVLLQNSSLVVTATDLDIRDLSHLQDSVKIGDGTDFLEVNADGSINVSIAAGAEIKITDGTDDLAINGDGSINSVVTATDLDIRDLSHTQDSVKVGDGTDFLAVNADGSVNITDNGGSITVDATDLDIRDLSHSQDSIKIGDGTDFVAVNTDGSLNVVVKENPGTEVIDYNTAAAVAGGASNNHDYTTTNFLLQGVYASASGTMKMELRVETGAATNVFNTIAVLFNSTANTNMEFLLKSAYQVPAGARVRVIRTNRQNQAQDVYSTILGIEQ